MTDHIGTAHDTDRQEPRVTTGEARDTAVQDGTATPAHERRRAQRGWYFYDWANSVFSTSVITVFLGPYLTDIAEAAAGPDGYVHPLGIPARAGAYFAYVVSASVLLSVLVMPLAGAVADRTGRKKALLGVFAYIGATATTAMFFVTGDRYLLGGGLLIVANVAFAAAMVLYNAFLPEIAAPHERDAVSSRGWAFGYAAGALMLVANLALFLGHDAVGVSKGMAVRICLAAAGLWWAAFTLVPLTRLRDTAPGGRPSADARGGSLRQGWRQLIGTVRDMRRHKLTLAFLLAYLVYNDGIQTVISQASLYGSEELELDETALIGAILLVQVLAVFGALLLGRLAARYGARRTVLGSLLAWTLTIGAGFFLPAGEPVAFFCLAAAIGMVLGGSQALSRSLFSHLIPRGKEAEYYSVYEISDRGTSWLGPLLFGLTYQLTGSYRYAIVSLVVFFVIGFVLLARVPMRRAVAAAGNPVPETI
ncbi:MFS transporter [Actinacidiphila sp. bgisy167]|uniref:MFS transporter n=1 Tax=Actinacidiphila sp. bgisy167 TaxID=3413797 RepID=UPI003D70614C